VVTVVFAVVIYAIVFCCPLEARAHTSDQTSFREIWDTNEKKNGM
jgi:hypothetical protein